MILTPEQPTLALHARNAAESAHPELWRGLVGAWVPALGYQGQRLLDLSSARSHGDLVQGAAWTTGPEGLAIRYDNAALVDNIFGLPKWMSDWTVTGQIRANDWNTSNRDGWFMLLDESGGRSIDFRAEDGNIAMGGSSGVGNHLLRDVSGETGWHSVAYTQLASSTRVGFWDGFRYGTASDMFNDPGDGASIGGVSANAPFQSNSEKWFGDIGPVMLWDRVLTDSEILLVSFDPLAPFRLRDDTALATAAMFGGTPSVTIPPPLLNMQMTGSF